MEGYAFPEPVISYPPELPVSAARDEIARAIAGHQVVIVAGATGSGKTTQLPKICLELGRTAIAHTQPRRIAARTIAERIAHELEVPLGGAVGYKVRFTDQVSADTKIALVTDGILLNEIHRDRLLRRYDTIIVDEAHERSLNIDFLLGYLARILPERPDLKVIITSATIDPESFAKHFADAAGPPDRRGLRPHLPGRDPLPRRRRGRRHGERRRRRRLAAALRELDREPDGDVLVFLPARRRSATRWMPSAACTRRTPAPPRCFRSTVGSPPPSSTACSSRRPCRAASPRDPRDERRRDEPHRPRHPLRRRCGHGAHLALQRADEDPAAADRGDLAGVGAAALRARRAHVERHRDPPLQRGRLPLTPRVHRARDPPHRSPRSSCRCSPSASATSRSSRSSRSPTAAA
jgi:energy-coupling factor transporter ATP-binding protein EcfA2